MAGGHSSAGWFLEGPDEEAVTGVLVNCSSNLFDVISLNSVTTPCFWRSLDANVDLAIEYSPVSFVGFNWVVVARLRFSGVSEGVVASIVTHDVDEVEVVTSSLQWIHPHATVGASRLGIFVFSVIVGANGEWSSSEEDFLVPIGIVRFNGITKVLDQIGQDCIGLASWHSSLELAPWLILVVEVNTIKTVLIDVLENALNLVLRHSGAWERESGTANTEDHLRIGILLSKFL